MPPEAETLQVTARWGDYEPVERDGRLVEWKRSERTAPVSVTVAADQSGPSSKELPGSDGLEIVTSLRRVRGLDNPPGLPKRTRAPSVFLVNRREAEEKPEIKDRRFIFQASLAVASRVPLVALPNPRGRLGVDEVDERIAAQYLSG